MSCTGPWENTDYTSKNSAAIRQSQSTCTALDPKKGFYSENITARMPGCSPAGQSSQMDTKGHWWRCLIPFLPFAHRRNLWNTSSGVWLSDLVKLCSRCRVSPQISQSFDFIPSFGESCLRQTVLSGHRSLGAPNDVNIGHEINARSSQCFALEMSNTGWVTVSSQLFRALSRKHLIMDHLRPHCLL